MRIVTRDETITTTNAVTTSTSTPVDVKRAKIISVQAVVDVNTPAAKTFVAGTSEVQTITTPSLVASADGDFCVITDGSAIQWAFYLDKTGLNSVPPTGAAYTGLAAGRKARVDISLAVTATDVSDKIRTALNALTGFTAAVTLSGTATVIATMVVRGPCTDPNVKAADGIAAATVLAGVQTTGGVASTVDITANTMTIATHGLTTGLKGQTSSTGTLPAGITTTTDYFVIAVDANTISLASSLALAQAGTALDLTNQGTNAATHTFTPTAVAGASLTLEKSNNYDPLYSSTGTWDAVEAATSISADGDIWISDIDPEYKWARLSYTLTAGRLSAVSYLIIKEDK